MPNQAAVTKHKEKTTADTMQYGCTMHPGMVMSKPGKCTKCGMNLQASKKEQLKMEVMKMYSCPMHPDMVSDKPGKCSKCGMAMTEVKTKSKKS